MSDDLAELVRASYATSMKRLRSDTAAYEDAARLVLDYMPNLSKPEARRIVAMLLSGALADVE